MIGRVDVVVLTGAVLLETALSFSTCLVLLKCLVSVVTSVVSSAFDVETVFLYPWAVAFHRLGLLAFIEALIFIAILVLALAYARRKGALEWS